VEKLPVFAELKAYLWEQLRTMQSGPDALQGDGDD
jgi:hypothetical protein